MCLEQFGASFLNFHEDQVLVVLGRGGGAGSAGTPGNRELGRVGQKRELELVLVPGTSKREVVEWPEHFY